MPSPTPTPRPHVAPRDSVPLIALFNATGGQNWLQKDNWLSDAPLGEWYGITTNDVGRVTEINLEQNWLIGRIPPELALLQRLERLNLSNSALRGDFPRELTSLAKLTHLDLGGNRFSGQIPYELGLLRDLTVVDLSSNRLSGEIPHNLVDSTTLTHLDLSRNQLTGTIPSTFAYGSKLQGLQLSGNQLTSGIPLEIERLRNLAELQLSDNQLTGEIPSAIGKLSQLERLELANNKLTGEIPSEMSELKRLDRLNLDNNQLTGGVPHALAEIESLHWLAVVDNNFTVCIPSELRRVPNSNIEYANVHVCGDPPRAETITPPYIEFVIGDEATPSQELAVRSGIQWLAEYLELIGWPIPDHKIAFFLGDYDSIQQGWADQLDNCDLRCAGERISNAISGAMRGLAFIRTFETAYYVIDAYAEYAALQTARAIQFGLLDERQRSSTHSGPSWLVEGMAGLIERLANSRGRDIPFSETRNEIVRIAQNQYEPLSSLEEGTSHCTGTCGTLAVELLASQVGLRELANYYTARPAGNNWNQTFERVFGITVPEFYARYEQHRLNGFPELQLPIVGTTDWPETTGQTP